MFNDWLRHGRFLNLSDDEYELQDGTIAIIKKQGTSDKSSDCGKETKLKTRNIKFFNYASAIKILKLEILQRNERCILEIEVSLPHFAEIKSIAIVFFPKINFILSELIRLEFLPHEAEDVFNSLEKMLSAIDKNNQHVEFPKELIQDLKSVFQNIKIDPNQTSNSFSELHKFNIPGYNRFEREIISIPKSDEISQKAFSESHDSSIILNSLTTHQKGIAAKIKWFLHYGKNNEESFQEIWSDLKLGENPNKSDSLGQFPLREAMLRGREDLVELLLFYKADPLLRPYKAACNKNAIEITLQWKLTGSYKIIMHFLSSFDRVKNQPSLNITDIKVYSEEDEIISSLKFSNNRRVKTRLMPSTNFHDKKLEKERNAVFDLFSNEFEDVEGNLVRFKEGFDANFQADQNKWVDLIEDQDQNKLIGFILYRILKENNTIIVKSEYGAIARNSVLRGSGSNTLFCRRAAFILKFITPRHTVIGYFITLSYLSYQLMTDELCTPKYQSKPMLNLNRALVREEFDSHTILHEGSFLEEPCLPRVKGQMPQNKSNKSDRSDKSISFDELCYNKFILFQDKSGFGIKYVRSAVVSTIIEKHSYENFRKRILDRSHYDIDAHLKDLATIVLTKKDKFLPMFNQNSLRVSEIISIKALIDERELFWNGEGVLIRSRL